MHDSKMTDLSESMLTESSKQVGRSENPDFGEDFPLLFREARTIKKSQVS